MKKYMKIVSLVDLLEQMHDFEFLLLCCFFSDSEGFDWSYFVLRMLVLTFEFGNMLG